MRDQDHFILALLLHRAIGLSRKLGILMRERPLEAELKTAFHAVPPSEDFSLLERQPSIYFLENSSVIDPTTLVGVSARLLTETPQDFIDATTKEDLSAITLGTKVLRRV